MLKTVQKFARSRVLTQIYSSKACFGGHGHAIKEYDWRDDPTVNTDIFVDPRNKGWDPSTYTFPYEGKDDWFFPIQRDAAYDPYDLTLNLRPENKVSDQDFTLMSVNTLKKNERGIIFLLLRLLTGTKLQKLHMKLITNQKILISKLKISRCK